MLLPIRTNVQLRRTPYANYAIIGLNVVIFMLQFGQDPRTGQLVSRSWVEHCLLVPGHSPWWTFVTYAFLHHDFWHILFNMFFLYLFGKNVNDRLGNWGYVVFYLLGAVFSGLGQAALHAFPPRPTLGASGAVAAVTGAYLVLFPKSLLTVVYWFFFIGTIELPALYFILLQMILLDNILARGRDTIAYDVHLAGYAYGILLVLLLLISRIIPATGPDLWEMIRQWNRRRQYRDVVASGYDPFTGTGGRRRVESREVPAVRAPHPEQARIERIRHEIAERIGQHNLAAAADLYLELMRIDPGQLLSRQYLLDIANQLASDHRPAEAARAYEQFLTHYDSAYEHSEQVELMLGILYARYLHDPDKAIQHLRKAAEKLVDSGQLQMCRAELARLSG
jgi:membrane associated rhomboid family serine protease